MAKSTRNDRIAGRNNQQAGHRAVEEHVHEEFVIVEAYAVGDPRTVMVHLEYAAVALWAVMAPIRLCLVAPLTDAHTTVSLALHWRCNAHHWWLVRSGLAASTSLLRGAIGSVERASGSVQILEIFMDNFFWLSSLLLNQLVGELLITISLVFLALSVLLRVHHWNRLFAMRRVRAHVPLFVLWNIARICHNSSHDGYNKHRWREGKDHCESDSFFAQILLLLLIIIPARIKRNLAVVLSDRWMQIELQ